MSIYEEDPFLPDIEDVVSQETKDLFHRLVDDIYDPEFANDEKATEMWHKISNGIRQL